MCFIRAVLEFLIQVKSSKKTGFIESGAKQMLQSVVCGVQKLLVKFTSKPFEAGTARHTPPIQKMPSRLFP